MQKYTENTLRVVSLQTRYGTWWEKMKMLMGNRKCNKASNIMGQIQESYLLSRKQSILTCQHPRNSHPGILLCMLAKKSSRRFSFFFQLQFPTLIPSSVADDLLQPVLPLCPHPKGLNRSSLLACLSHNVSHLPIPKVVSP